MLDTPWLGLRYEWPEIYSDFYVWDPEIGWLAWCPMTLEDEFSTVCFYTTEFDSWAG